MFLLTEENKKTEGAYAVKDRNGEKVLFMFSDKDDALRYALQLEDEHGTKMNTLEVEEDLAIKACEMYNYKYTIITPDDIVIPPSKDDNI